VSDLTPRAPRRHEASIDRIGLALGSGSLLSGCIVAILAAIGGQRAPLALLGAWVFGGLFAGMAISAIGGPLWLVLHAAGLRRAHHAALAGAAIAMAILIGAQTYGFGLIDVPPMDERTWLFRWLSAIATGLLAAILAAAIGAAMWRIAYREAVDGD
jgi:MFS family permease